MWDGFSQALLLSCLISSQQAGLQPRDPVEVVYEVTSVEGGEREGVTSLQRIISEHLDYIESTTKGPVCPLTPDRDLRHAMAEEEQKVCLCVCVHVFTSRY